MSPITKFFSIAALAAAFTAGPALVSSPALDLGNAYAGKYEQDMKRKAMEEKRQEQMKAAEGKRKAMEAKQTEMRALNEEHQKAVKELNEKMQGDMQSAKTPEERKKVQMEHSAKMQALQKEMQEKRKAMMDK